MCLELGISDRKIKEYLQILENSGKVFVDRKKDFLRYINPHAIKPTPPVTEEKAKEEFKGIVEKKDLFEGVMNG